MGAAQTSPEPEYDITFANTHCHPEGREMGQLTLQQCKIECSRLGCKAFSFYSTDFFGFAMTSCAICGFRTRIENGSVVIDGNFSSVLAPALLREARAGYNIYEPTHGASKNEPVCDTRHVSDWLLREIFLPVVAEANASADGRLNATDAQGMLAVLNVHVGANITRAASDCSIIAVDSAMLKDGARAALHAEGVPTSRCEVHEDRVASLVSDLALHALNISTHGTFSVPFADTLASLVSTAARHYLVPDVITNTGTCEATEALNATLEAAVGEFLAGPSFVALWSSVLAGEAACAGVLALAQQAASLGILTDLNATASGTLNATHAAVLEGLVAQHLQAGVSVPGLNCTDLAAVMAVLHQRSFALVLAVSQHPLFQAHGALPETQRVVVAMTVRLAISMARFDAAARTQYRTGVAAACAVDLAAVRITSVWPAGAQQRRLLQVQVDDANEALEVETAVDTVLAEAGSVLANAQNTTELRTQVQRQMGGDVDLQMQVAPAATLAPATTPALAPAAAPSPTPGLTPEPAVQDGKNEEHERAWVLPVLLAAVPCAVLCVVGVRGRPCARGRMHKRAQLQAIPENQPLVSAPKDRHLVVVFPVFAAEHACSPGVLARVHDDCKGSIECGCGFG
jgi:hypothetical protein